MIVAGSMIGSGIFIVSADIVRQVGSPAGLLSVWLASGLMTIAGALAYGELATMMPEAGGQYIFLREAYGEMVAFAFGWSLFLAIQTGTIAAVAVAFGRFTGVLWPTVGARVFLGREGLGLSGERLVAIAVIAALTMINLRGLNLGRAVQNAFTSAKILALLAIILLGCIFASRTRAIALNFGSSDAFLGTHSFSSGWFAAFGAAMVGGLFSSDAWATVTFVAAEARDPHRDLPRALALGTAVVIALYLLTNVSYLCELPARSLQSAAYQPGFFAQGIAGAHDDRVATAAMRSIFGSAGAMMTALVVMISTFGCANGLILTGARVMWAMARDRVFFASGGQLNQAAVPAIALITQGVWSALLAISGTYSELLDYVIFTQLLFYVLTVGAVFLLRRRRPDWERPYRAWGYPIVPGAYMCAALALMADLLVLKPRSTWPGLLIALSAVPIYYLAMHRRLPRALFSRSVR